MRFEIGGEGTPCDASYRKPISNPTAHQKYRRTGRGEYR
jgi:hypothetical protein